MKPRALQGWSRTDVGLLDGKTATGPLTRGDLLAAAWKTAFHKWTRRCALISMLEMVGYFGPIRSTIGPVPLRKQTSAARTDSAGTCQSEPMPS